MTVTHVETTTQVIVHAYTELRLEDFVTGVKSRTARIEKATVHWDYENGEWTVGAVDIWGPVIRKDGSESTQHIRELTRPAWASNAQYGVVTPQEIIDVALQHVPAWAPSINATRYPRTTKLRNSL